MNEQPTVSVVIPTINEEKNIDKCLSSIAKQDYPANELEVIIVDNYSTDDTVNIARKYPVKVVYNRIKHAEVSKMVGFRKARGEFCIYLDADVELKGKNWFQKMLRPLLNDSNIIGSFTRKYSKKTDPPLERFLAFHPLQQDSLFQLFSPTITQAIVKKEKGYYVCDYKNKKIPAAGRCLYRRKNLLKLVKGYEMFLELDFLVLLALNGYERFAYVPSAGLYHHHAPNMKVLLRKRRYNVQKVYLKTIDNKLYRWFDLSNPVDLLKITLWIVYASLIIPSIIVGFYKSVRFKDWVGIYEPVVNLLVTYVIVFSFVQHGYLKLLLNNNYAK